jgi:CheY-like chemotaxis protein
VRLSQLASALGRLLDGAAARVPSRSRPVADGLDVALGTRFPLRVLLAEDNRINQKVALKLLERMGYQADVAADGFEVLAALDRQRYDVILMDIQMPGMDGIEAARTIRETRPGNEQPAILALTANATQQDAAECLDAGMDGFLSKPVAPAALAKALERCGRARLGDVGVGPHRMSV